MAEGTKQEWLRTLSMDEGKSKAMSNIIVRCDSMGMRTEALGLFQRVKILYAGTGLQDRNNRIGMWNSALLDNYV